MPNKKTKCFVEPDRQSKTSTSSAKVISMPRDNNLKRWLIQMANLKRCLETRRRGIKATEIAGTKKDRTQKA